LFLLPKSYDNYIIPMLFFYSSTSGGALIAPSVVLFAAHCGDYKNLQVNVGSYRRYSAEYGAEPRFCNQWASDPSFVDGRDTLYNDFALCLLDREVILDESKVKLILNLDENVPQESGDELIVMGLGRLEENGSSRKYLHSYRMAWLVISFRFVLFHRHVAFLSLSLLNLPPSSFVLSFLSAEFLNDVTVPTISNEDCNKRASYDGSVTDAMLCAGYPEGGKDSCQGDSGGPIVKRTILADGTKQDTHVGIVSWGEGCALRNKPGVYARTSSGSSWIIEQVCNVWGLPSDFCPELPKTTSDDEDCDQKLDIQVVTNRYAYETALILREQNNGPIELIRRYQIKYYKYDHSVCLKSDTCYDFRVEDFNGMCFNDDCGSFKLELNGKTELIGDPNFERKSSFPFCTYDCDAFVDSEDVVYKKGKKCDWVTKNDKSSKIKKKCKKKYKGVRVYDACPFTCGTKVGLGKCADLSI
jgi:hypothetical protein